MPPASSYRPLLPAIKAPPPPPPQDDSEPPPTPKRKREMVAVACNNCRSSKIACDGKRPLCGQCTRRQRATPRACCYRDRHETHAALRRRAEALQAELTAREKTLDLLVSLPVDDAVHLLCRLRSTRPPLRQPPPRKNDDGPPPPLSLSRSALPLPDGVGAPPATCHDGHDDNPDHDGTENCCANPMPLADDATLSLPTTCPAFDSSRPSGPIPAFVFPAPLLDPGEYLYPYEDGLSTPVRLPTTPTAESDMQWRQL